MKTIRNKVMSLVLVISLAAIVVLGTVSCFGIWRIRCNTDSSLKNLNKQATSDTTDALQNQKKEELQSLVQNKSNLADISLNLILNQTRIVAMAAEDIFENAEEYTRGQAASSLPVDSYDFSCNYPESTIGQFSFHIRAPRDVMDPASIVEEDGEIVKAELDENSLSETMRKDLYLAGYLKGALGGIRNFDNGDGTYNGIGATYICLESSGIDVLADTLTMSMVEYDARESVWYTEAAKLEEGEVFWTNPVQDSSGRGTALICAMPVYADGRFIGVAGSGGLIDNIRELVQSTTIGDSGYAFLVNTSGEQGVNVIANANQDENSEINQYRDDLLQSGNEGLIEVVEKMRNKESGISVVSLDGKESYIAYSPLETTDWSMVAVISADDASIITPIKEQQENIGSITQDANERIAGMIGLMAAAFVAAALSGVILVVLFSYKFSNRLAEPIRMLTEGVKQISGGDLDFQIHVDSNDETEVLGQAFNSMTKSLKDYIANLSQITAEKERISAELNVAAKIQTDMLPCIFPPFPERHEFDIYASMTPAKEVGGDFYDFFLVDDDHLALVMADVSGKGVPAALFMVIAKTLLKNAAQTGLSPKEVLEKVNNQLCENNDAEMFVTVWVGIYEISTGRLTASNAGHEYPVIRRAGGDFELVKDRHGFVLAGMENTRYREYELNLGPEDMLFVYTDGVAEATDGSNNLYGTDRMLAALNSRQDGTPEEVLLTVKEDIEKFVGDAPQFDDITMLAMQRKDEGEKTIRRISVKPDFKNMEKILDMINETMESREVPAKIISQFDVAADEIFSNIIRYSHARNSDVEISAELNRIRMRFSDDGIPYDPTKQPEPDITLSAEEREIGGLGIFMVKKSMDRILYEYADGRNILIIEKGW